MIQKTTAIKSNTMITIRIITTARDDEPELALELWIKKRTWAAVAVEEKKEPLWNITSIVYTDYGYRLYTRRTANMQLSHSFCPIWSWTAL